MTGGASAVGVQLGEDERSALAVLAANPGECLPLRFGLEWVGPHAGGPGNGPTRGFRVQWDDRAHVALDFLVAEGLAERVPGMQPEAWIATPEGLALAKERGLRPGSVADAMAASEDERRR